MKFNINSSINDIFNDIQDNKKDMFNNDYGAYEFRGAGDKSLMISNGSSKEWIKWDELENARQDILIGIPIKKLGIAGIGVGILYELPESSNNKQDEIVIEIKRLYNSLSSDKKVEILDFFKSDL